MPPAGSSAASASSAAADPSAAASEPAAVVSSAAAAVVSVGLPADDQPARAADITAAIDNAKNFFFIIDSSSYLLFLFIFVYSFHLYAHGPL